MKPRFPTFYRWLMRLFLARRQVLATSSFAAIAVGLWWERPSLALIVPGSLVFACLVWNHIRGTSSNA